MKSIFLVSTVLSLAAAAAFAAASAPRQAILDQYAASAKMENPAFAGFSASAGQAFFMAKQSGGKPDTLSCTACHTADPSKAGQTRAGKEIKPMAVSANPERFTDHAQVEKWFGRNCDSVLGRQCTATEKGNFITFMSGR